MGLLYPEFSPKNPGILEEVLWVLEEVLGVL